MIGAQGCNEYRIFPVYSHVKDDLCVCVVVVGQTLYIPVFWLVVLNGWV